MKNNTLILVVDFANKTLLMREELFSNGKKEKEKIERIQDTIAKLTSGEFVAPIYSYNKQNQEEKAS